MDEIWERAVETALAGETEPVVLTLDGAVKCVKGHLPRPEILEKYPNLEHLSIASVGVSSLDRFPRLGKLQKLVLSDNRISGGLEFLVRAGLGSLRDLDLSNNRIGLFEDLKPLAELKLVSLDLYKCPVTKVKDYRARVFGLVKSLKYLDKMDDEENEIPESDDEDEEEERTNVFRNGHSEEVVEVDEDESEAGDDGDDPEIDAEKSNGHIEEVLEVDEEESEADEEERVKGRESNGVSDHTNGFRDEHLNMNEEDDDSDEEEHIHGELDGHEEVAEVSDFVTNGAQDVLMDIDEEENEDSGEEDEYEPDGLIVDDTHEIEEEDVSKGVEEVDFGVPHGNELLRNILVGEIEHEQDEEDDDDSWEEEEDDDVEDGEEEEYGTGGLGRSMAEAIPVDEEDSDDEVQVVYSIASSNLKRKRDEDDDGDSVSTSPYNSDDDNSSDGVSSDDEDE